MLGPQLKKNLFGVCLPTLESRDFFFFFKSDSPVIHLHDEWCGAYLDEPLARLCKHHVTWGFQLV